MENIIRLISYNYHALRLRYVWGCGEPPAVYTLSIVVVHAQRQNVLENRLNTAIKIVVSKLSDEEIFLDLDRKLARIPSFNNILIVNIDNFVERAFDTEGLREGTGAISDHPGKPKL